MSIQSEAALEAGLIATLRQMDYEYVQITEEDNLYANFKRQLEIHNNKKQLAEAGLIRKVEGLDGSVHFDHNTHNHYHFVCIKCNKVYDVPCEVAPDLNQKVLVKTGLQVISHDITFKGICQHCQKHN